MARKRKDQNSKEDRKIERQGINIEKMFDIDLYVVKEGEDGMLHPLNKLDEHLNKRHSDGWDFVRMFYVGSDKRNISANKILGLLFKKISTCACTSMNSQFIDIEKDKKNKF